MSRTAKAITILYADDDAEDRMLVKDAWAENRLANELHFVEDGEELMDYLRRRGNYTHLADQPLPGMILLDLNMPTQRRPRGSAGDQSRPAPAIHSGRRSDHVESRRRYSARLRSGSEFVHPEAGNLSVAGRPDPDIE